MRKIKLYPAPHLEVRIHVTEEMIADLKECRRMAEESDFENTKDCEACSWHEVKLTEYFNACEILGLEGAIENVK